MPDVFVSQEEKTPIVPDKISKKEMREEHAIYNSHNPLSSFSFYPDHVDFETREKEEKVILLLRQHPIVNLKWILVAALMVLVPSLVKYFGILSTLPSGVELVIGLSWYLITMIYVLESFLDWYFNVYFVTTERVMDVDFYNLIDKKVSDAGIDKIQDISYTHYGVWRMLFNYGDVIIQTASEVPEFDFMAVPNPERVVKIINDLKDKTE